MDNKPLDLSKSSIKNVRPLDLSSRDTSKLQDTTSNINRNYDAGENTRNEIAVPGPSSSLTPLDLSTRNSAKRRTQTETEDKENSQFNSSTQAKRRKTEVNKGFTIEKLGESKKWKRMVEEKRYKVKFHPEKIGKYIYSNN